MDELIETFNKQFPVGSTVRWRSVASEKVSYREYTVSRPAVNHNGQAVAWFKERSGMASIEPGFVDYEQ